MFGIKHLPSLLLLYVVLKTCKGQTVAGSMFDVTEFITSTFATFINPGIALHTVKHADQTSYAFQQITSGQVVIQGTITEKMVMSSTFMRGPFYAIVTNEFVTKHFTTDSLDGITFNTEDKHTVLETYTMPGVIIPTRAAPFPIGYNITKIVSNTFETILSTNQQGATLTFSHEAIGETITQNPINNVPFLSPGAITRTRLVTNSFTNAPSTTYQTILCYTYNFQLPYSLPPQDLHPFTRDSGTFPIHNNFQFKFPSIFNNEVTNQNPPIFPSRHFSSGYYFNRVHNFGIPINPFHLGNIMNFQWPSLEDIKLLNGNVSDSGPNIHVTEIVTTAIQTLVFTVGGVPKTSTVTSSNKEVHSSTMPPNFNNFGNFDKKSATADIKTISGTTIYGTTSYITHQYVTRQP